MEYQKIYQVDLSPSLTLVFYGGVGDEETTYLDYRSAAHDPTDVKIEGRGHVIIVRLRGEHIDKIRQYIPDKIPEQAEWDSQYYYTLEENVPDEIREKGYLSDLKVNIVRSSTSSEWRITVADTLIDPDDEKIKEAAEQVKKVKIMPIMEKVVSEYAKKFESLRGTGLIPTLQYLNHYVDRITFAVSVEVRKIVESIQTLLGA